jgi:hypothetical protein
LARSGGASGAVSTTAALLTGIFATYLASGHLSNATFAALFLAGLAGTLARDRRRGALCGVALIGAAGLAHPDFLVAALAIMGVGASLAWIAHERRRRSRSSASPPEASADGSRRGPRAVRRSEVRRRHLPRHLPDAGGAGGSAAAALPRAARAEGGRVRAVGLAPVDGSRADPPARRVGSSPDRLVHRVSPRRGRRDRASAVPAAPCDRVRFLPPILAAFGLEAIVSACRGLDSPW